MALVRVPPTDPPTEDDVLAGMSFGRKLLDGVECFLCFGELGGPGAEGYPIIYWHHGPETVYFHAACAADFCFRLGQDVQTLKHEDSLRIALISNETDPR